MSTFTDKTVFITGSTGGLGKTIAQAYLAAGAQVVICHINSARLKEAEDEFDSSERVFTRSVDTTHGESVQALIEAAVKRFGCLDVLVNNAGVRARFGGMISFSCCYREDKDV
jgi:NAD(P)-dependent dehydrogenase (short-subunit alcohol dehydrogenase family)